LNQKISKIELSGEESVINSLKDFEIDLAKIEIKKEVGKVEFLVKDLNLAENVSLVSVTGDDAVLEITVTEKPKDDSKKDEETKLDNPVILNTKSDVPAGDAQDDGGGGSSGV
jgi:hypothetical protein